MNFEARRSTNKQRQKKASERTSERATTTTIRSSIGSNSLFVCVCVCANSACCSCCGSSNMFEARTFAVGQASNGSSKDSHYSSFQKSRFPKNVVRNQKYSVFSFIPIVSVASLFHFCLFLCFVCGLLIRFACNNIIKTGVVSAVLGLLELVLPGDGVLAVLSAAARRLLVHVLGPVVVRDRGDDGARGLRRLQALQTRQGDQLGQVQDTHLRRHQARLQLQAQSLRHHHHREESARARRHGAAQDERGVRHVLHTHRSAGRRDGLEVARGRLHHAKSGQRICKTIHA